MQSAPERQEAEAIYHRRTGGDTHQRQPIIHEAIRNGVWATIAIVVAWVAVTKGLPILAAHVPQVTKTDTAELSAFIEFTAALVVIPNVHGLFKRLGMMLYIPALFANVALVLFWIEAAKYSASHASTMIRVFGPLFTDYLSKLTVENWFPHIGRIAAALCVLLAAIAASRVIRLALRYSRESATWARESDANPGVPQRIVYPGGKTLHSLTPLAAGILMLLVLMPGAVRIQPTFATANQVSWHSNYSVWKAEWANYSTTAEVEAAMHNLTKLCWQQNASLSTSSHQVCAMVPDPLVVAWMRPSPQDAFLITRSSYAQEYPVWMAYIDDLIASGWGGSIQLHKDFSVNAVVPGYNHGLTIRQASAEGHPYNWSASAPLWSGVQPRLAFGGYLCPPRSNCGESTSGGFSIQSTSCPNCVIVDVSWNNYLYLKNGTKENSRQRLIYPDTYDVASHGDGYRYYASTGYNNNSVNTPIGKWGASDQPKFPVFTKNNAIVWEPMSNILAAASS